jgi:HipA-like kinase
LLKVYPATRYVVPLREGGSLPAVVDTEDGGLFVAKFRGAGQGAKALVAELVVAGLGQALGLPVPDVALIELDESFGRTERDPEIQDILRGSRGTNFGMRYLEGAFNYDSASDEVEADLAADIVWLDAFVTNVDRTAKNPNMMWARDRIWLIDHGAALYFHHNWPKVDGESARNVFANVKDHVLLGMASDLTQADERLSARLTDEIIAGIVNELPESLLMDAPEGQSPAFAAAEENREAYRRYLSARLSSPRPFLRTAVEAREERRSGRGGGRKGYRR